jgi:hypothetical protein
LAFVCTNLDKPYLVFYFNFSDISVPNGSYNFTFDDIAGDGFTAGSGSFFKVFVNGYEVGAVDGDFGNTSTIMIDHHSTSSSPSSTGNNGKIQENDNDTTQSSSSSSSSSGDTTSFASKLVIPCRSTIILGWFALLIILSRIVN